MTKPTRFYRNHEGYFDPTAGKALSTYMKDYKEKQRQRYADKHRKKVYVASPYAGDIEGNKKRAIAYCRAVSSAGYMPIASHLLYPQILDDSDLAQRELGLLYGLALLALCDEIWVFGEVSPGMAQEIEEAKRLNIRIRYQKGMSV